MTKKELKSNISSLVKKTMNNNNFSYNHIGINDKVQMLSIEGKFFAQGESAQELLNEAIFASNTFGLNVKTCLVFILESSGLFNK